MPTKVKTVVVVDDDQDQADLLAEALTSETVRVRAFADPIRALAAISQDAIDLLVADLSMPWIDGMDVIAGARVKQPDLRVILISGLEDGARVAERHGVQFFLKPIDLPALRRAAQQALNLDR